MRNDHGTSTPKAHRSKTATGTSTSRLPAAPQAQGDSPAVGRRTWNVPTLEDPPLIRALLKEASRRGHRMADMAEALDITYGYIAQLRSGHRKPEHVSQTFADACGRYLGVPTALVKLWAGRVSITDFAWPARSREREVAEGLDSLRDDPAIGSLVPDALFTADPSVREFVWQIYQECTGAHPQGLRAMPTALDYLQRAALNEAEFEQELYQLRKEMTDVVASAAAMQEQAA